MQRNSQIDEIHDEEFNDEPAFETVKRPAYVLWAALVAVLGTAGFAAHVGWKERRRLLGEAAQNEQALRDLQKRFKALETEKAALVAERETLQKSVQAKDTALAQLQETQDKIQEKMKAEIAKGEIALTNSGGRLRVDMVDKILFESGDAHISRRGEEVLERVGGVLASVPDRQIQVSGHTDNEPIRSRLKRQFPTNWELSASRALNVVRFLQEKAKVPAGRLVASGHGEHQPIASNDSAAGRARNRRIEILLTPPLAPEPVGKDELEAQSADTQGRAPAVHR
jgi:chemotaxis protein MotB